MTTHTRDNVLSGPYQSFTSQDLDAKNVHKTGLDFD
jgi:hypothetical protein